MGKEKRKRGGGTRVDLGPPPTLEETLARLPPRAAARDGVLLYTALCFLRLSGMWRDLEPRYSDKVDVTYLVLDPAPPPEDGDEDAAAAAAGPAARRRTVAVPVMLAGASLSPKRLHALFELVENDEDPLSIVYIASDSTVTVSYLYNYPRPPDVLEERAEDAEGHNDEHGDGD